LINDCASPDGWRHRLRVATEGWATSVSCSMGCSAQNPAFASGNPISSLGFV
jgi:hypothetical protein